MTDINAANYLECFNKINRL